MFHSKQHSTPFFFNFKYKKGNKFYSGGNSGHLDKVHESIVAVLQEVYAEFTQEEPHVQDRAALGLSVSGHLFTLGHTPHGLPRVMGVVFKLREEKENTRFEKMSSVLFHNTEKDQTKENYQQVNDIYILYIHFID